MREDGGHDDARQDRLRVEISGNEVTIEVETYASKARMTIGRAQAEQVARRILGNQPRGYVETTGLARRAREEDGNRD